MNNNILPDERGIIDEKNDNLLEAADAGDLDTVLSLLESKANVNYQGPQYYLITPLHRAGATGRFEVAQALIAHKADPNILNRWGWTPLHPTCQGGFHKLVRLMLDARSNPNTQDLNHDTPLLLAAQRGHLEVVKVLLQCRRVDISLKGDKGLTALEWAEANGHRKVVEAIRQASSSSS